MVRVQAVKGTRERGKVKTKDRGHSKETRGSRKQESVGLKIQTGGRFWKGIKHHLS